MEPEGGGSSEGSPSTSGRGPAAAARALRRPSFAPHNALEPLIVVEESLDGDEDDEVAGATAAGDAASGGSGAGGSRDEASPSPPAEADLNPYLLCPWRDTRKSSLPTPACASGITASQVRRLSERGPESGPSPREQEFLATLSAMPGPTPGGRRHSVVISRVPPPALIMFGRGRRESIAAFSAAASRPAALASSTHNLQLDLMDDLLEFKAAKKGGTRRASELPGLPSHASPPIVNRRKSELPPRIPREFAAEVAELAAEAQAEAKRRDEGIVCSNSDLLTLCGAVEPAAAASPPPPPPVVVAATPSPLAARLISLRNDSVEIKEVREPEQAPPPRSTVLVSLRGDRPQSSLAAAPPPPPKVVVAAPKVVVAAPKVVVAAPKVSVKDVPRPAPEGVDSAAPSTSGGLARRDSDKVMWDERSGSLVDAGVLGSAIEGFLNKDASVKNKKGTTNSVHRATAQLSAWVTAVAIWNPRGTPSATATPAAGTPQAGTPHGATPQATPQDTPESTPRRRARVSCDAVCSTLKSLFVK